MLTDAEHLAILGIIGNVYLYGNDDNIKRRLTDAEYDLYETLVNEWRERSHDQTTWHDRKWVG